MTYDLYDQIGHRIRNKREQLGISQEKLAKQMGYSSAATVSHFEKGIRKISIADLQQLSEILGVPIEHFVGETNLETPGFLLRGAKDIRPSARRAVIDFLSFASKHGEKLPDLSYVNKQSPGKAAESILEKLGIHTPPISPQQIAKNSGIPVFQWDFPNEVSGIFVSVENAACIGVNINHPYVRQRFTLAHELGHLVFHKTEEDLFVDFLELEIAMISLEESEVEKYQEKETKANQFAADLLMPFRWVIEDYRKYGKANLALLANRYEVSEQALWFRLLNLHLVSD